MTLLPNAETHHIECGSAIVTYHDNQADAPVLVLIHGTGGDMERHYGRLIPMLASKYRVVGIDLGTSLQDEQLELEHYVSQVTAVAERLGLAAEDVTVVGYSLGAVVAAAFAAHHSEVVDRLVLVSGWAKTDTFQRLRNEVWRRLYEESSGALPRFSLLTVYSARHLNARTTAEVAQLLAGAKPDEVRLRQMELNARIDISSMLPAIGCPTLVICGDEDAMVPISHGYELLGAIEQARLAILPTGHGVLSERPAQIYSLVDQFARNSLSTPAGDVYAHPAV